MAIFRRSGARDGERNLLLSASMGLCCKKRRTLCSWEVVRTCVRAARCVIGGSLALAFLSAIALGLLARAPKTASAGKRFPPPGVSLLWFAPSCGLGGASDGRHRTARGATHRERACASARRCPRRPPPPRVGSPSPSVARCARPARSALDLLDRPLHLRFALALRQDLVARVRDEQGVLELR